MVEGALKITGPTLKDHLLSVTCLRTGRSDARHQDRLCSLPANRLRDDSVNIHKGVMSLNTKRGSAMFQGIWVQRPWFGAAN